MKVECCIFLSVKQVERIITLLGSLAISDGGWADIELELRESVIKAKNAARGYRRCSGCDQPMLPEGVRKKPDEYDHALGCPLAPKKRKVAK